MPYPDTRHRLIDLLKQFGIAALYALFMLLDHRYFEGVSKFTLFEPASGLALAVLLIGGKRYAWAVLLGAILSNAEEVTFWEAIIISSADTLEALCAAWLLMRDNRFDPAIRTLRDYLRLILLGAASVAIAGNIDAMALLVFGFIPPEAYFHELTHWWLGDMLGIILITPLILVCRPIKSNLPKINRIAEFVLLLGLMLLAGQIIFLGWFHDSLGNVAKGYLMFLFVVWVAMRLGARGAVITINIVGIQALLGAYHGAGYFANDVNQTHLTSYWLYMTALSVVGMALATFISEQKRSEEALRRSETKFRTLYDSIGDAVHLMDETGFIDCNNATLAMCGCATKEEFCSKSPVDFSPPVQPCGTNSAVLIEQYIAMVMKTGSQRFDWVCKRFDNGKLFDIDVQLTAMELDGKPVFLVVTRDITERKTAEAVLRQSELKFRTLYESTNDAVMLLDEKGFFDCNKATLEMIGCATKEEFCSKHPADLSPPEQPCGTDSFTLANRYIATAMKQGNCRFEWASKRVDTGRIFIADVLLSALELEGRLVVQAVIRDVTEQKHAIEEFERFFNLIPDMACIASTDGYFKKINRAWQATLGYTEQEILSTPFLEFIHPEDIGATLKEVERQLACGKPSRFSNRYRCKDGGYKLLEWDMIPPIDGTLLYGSARDVTEQRRAEDELNRFFDLVPDLVCIASIDGRFLRINRAWQTTLGYTEQEILSTPFIDFIHPDDRDATMKEVERQIAGKATIHFGNRYRCKDGSYKWLEWDATPAVDKTLLFASARDVTERKQSEERLQKNKERLRSYLDNISDTIWVVRENLDIAYVSSGVTRLMGILPEESIGRPSSMYIHPDDMDAIGNATQYLMEHPGEPKTVQYRVKHKDGRWIPVESTGINLLNNPAINGVLVAMRDITERKHTEDELRLTKERYDFATAIGKVGTWDWNPVTGVLVWSDETFRLMGFAPGSVTPSYELYLSLLHPDDKAALDSAVQVALHGRESYDLDCRVVLGSGKELTCHVTGKVEFDAEARPVRMLGTIQDITERKTIEQRLHDLSSHMLEVREEEKSRIAREIHDELGGTLAALKMDAYWLSRKLPMNEETALHIERIKLMAQRVDSAVNTTRRVIADLRPSILDDLGLLAALEWQAAEFYKRTGIECRVNCIEDEANLDKQRSTALFRILQEALTNVSRHSGASSVEIKFHHGENEVILIIKDNGCGIPESGITASKLYGQKSYGMLGMTERVEQLRGKIIFSSPQEGGFVVAVILPLPVRERSS